MKFLKTLLPFLSAVTLLGAAEKPNILFILADDQSPFDFKFHNPESTLDSPNIDRLATEGMIFDAAYHMGSFSGAVCMPSRHMIMSGRTVWRLPVGPGAKDCPPKLEENVRDEVSVSGVWQRRDEATIRNEIGREYACSENIDIQIGRVLKRLEDAGELDNTYVFYTADHGMAIGRHGLQGKQNLYEHTWRVPMVVKGPGIKPGGRAPGNIYLGDLLATFCDLTGIAPPETNEGTSFKHVLLGEKQTVRDTLYGVYSGGDKPGIRSVKQGDWKLIEYESTSKGVRESQLFNLKENPHEFLAEHNQPEATNLAADPEHAAKLTEMRTLLLAEMRRLNDPWRFSDQPDDGLTPPKNGKPRDRKKPKKQ